MKNIIIPTAKSPTDWAIVKQSVMSIPVSSLETWRKASSGGRSYLLFMFDVDKSVGTGTATFGGISPNVPLDIILESHFRSPRDLDILKWLYWELFDFFEMNAIDEFHFERKEFQEYFDEANEARRERGSSFFVNE